jgi:hypothetical protein
MFFALVVVCNGGEDASMFVHGINFCGAKMKKACLIIMMSLLVATSTSAMTIDTETDYDVVYNSPQRVNTTFGKLPSTGEYGVFVHITCRAEEGENKRESLFYRLSTGVQREDNTLYTEVEGQKLILAEKKWMGWKNAAGVKIHHRLTGKPYPTCKVWIENSEE